MNVLIVVALGFFGFTSLSSVYSNVCWIPWLGGSGKQPVVLCHADTAELGRSYDFLRCLNFPSMSPQIQALACVRASIFKKWESPC